MNPFSFINIIAEKRIQEAMEAGEFDNLPGSGKPLVFEDMRHVPPELRMAWKILKNSHCLPPELQKRKEISTLLEMLEGCPEEHLREKCIRKLRLLLSNMPGGARRHLALEANDEYYRQILARLEHHEREHSQKMAGAVQNNPGCTAGGLRAALLASPRETL